MNLLEEIALGAASDEMPLGTMLRKCLLLGSRLRSKPVEEWAECELNGYLKDIALPSYRKLSLVMKANMSGVGRQANGWVVPPALLGPNADQWMTLDYRNSIGAIEHVLEEAINTGGLLELSMADLPLFLQEQRGFTHMWFASAWGELSSSQVKHILETLRNRVLKFVLDLGKEYPEAGTVRSPASKMTEKADQIFVNSIYGPANVGGMANDSRAVINITPRRHQLLGNCS